MAEEHERFAERLVAADRTPEPAGDARARREQEMRDMIEMKLTTMERILSVLVALVCLGCGVRLLMFIGSPGAEWKVMALFWQMMLVCGVGMIGLGGLTAYPAIVGTRRQPGFSRAVALFGGLVIAALSLTFVSAAADVPDPTLSSTLRSIGYVFFAILAVTVVLHMQEERHRETRIKLLELEMKLDALAERQSSRGA